MVTQDSQVGEDPTRARFGAFAPGSGGYESFYVKVSAPGEPQAAWIRYTVLQRPGEPPRGSLWFTWFDAGASHPVASKVSPPASELGVPPGEWLRIGEATFGPAGLRGSASSDRLDAAWELSYEAYEGAADPLWHLPRRWMYTAPFPRTKLLSPCPDVRFSGWLRVGERTVALDGWPGMVGHNWGAQHAERWIWLQGALFEGHDHDTWLDVALGRLKLGPVTTPWVANGVLSLAGRRHRIGGIGRARATRVAEASEECDLVLPGPGIVLRGRVSAPRKDIVGWLYADPDGSEHYVANCSIADLTLTVEREDAAPLTLRTTGSAAYELGTRERDQGIEVQPFD